jgi:rod shape-determining protein MreD
MKWVPFAILALAAVILHTTVAPRLAFAGVRPDWILIAVVFFAIHARNVDVVIAGWVLGLLADMQTVERFGLLSLTYAAAAAITYGTREHVFRFHPLAHFAVTLAVGAFVQAVLLGYDVFAGGAADVIWTQRLVSGGLVAAYTALWAPPMYAALFRLAPWLGLEIPRYSHVGLSRLRR